MGPPIPLFTIISRVTSTHILSPFTIQLMTSSLAKKHYFRITSTPLFTHQPGLDGKFYAKNLLRFQLSLHHITLNTPKDMFGAVNVGKKY
jgi:hypothetical protein